ncbi:MAG: efflux RND transporter periplasmic adaptor subunit [Candidatus Krumholzibacteriota bacterium]
MSAKTLRNCMTATIIVILGAAMAMALVKLGKKPERKAPPQSRPVVSAFTVAPGTEKIRVISFGSVKAKRSINVVPRVNGEVVEKSPHFEAGGYFTAGQTLLRIDDTDYILAAEQARANVAQSEYNLARAEEEAQVAQREWERIGNAGMDPDASGEPTALVMHEPQLKLARANLKSAKAALDQAELNLKRCTLSAPFDGRVLDSAVDAGQFIRSGTSLGTIYATDIAEVTVTIADDDLAWITVNYDAADGGAPVDVSADFAGDRHHWQGRAVRLGGAVDNRSRLVSVVVEIPNPYERSANRPPLIEGMFVDVLFQTDPPAGAVVIPRTALRPGDQVWVVDEERNLRIRDVQVARAGVEQAIITEGLASGDRICTSNLQYVTEGMPVRVEGDPVPAAEKPGPDGKKGGE